MPKFPKLVVRLIALFAPLLLLWVWLTFAYTPRYASTTRFVLRNQQDASLSLGANSLLGGGGQEQQDLHMMREYIYSPNLLEILDQELDLRAKYASRDILPPQRLDTDAPGEAFLEKYRSLLTIDIDTETGLMTLEVEGFDPDTVYRQSQRTLLLAEEYVNSAFHHIAERQASTARAVLEEARLERQTKAGALLDFQNKHQTFRPDLDGSATQSTIAALERALSQEKAALTAKSAYLSDSAPTQIESRAKISAIKEQIEKERAQLVSSDQAGSGGEEFNRLLANFEMLKLDLDLASRRYSESLASLQRAQLAASENLKSLVVVSSPIRADSPSYPRTGVWMLLATVAVLLTHQPLFGLLCPKPKLKKKP